MRFRQSNQCLIVGIVTIFLGCTNRNAPTTIPAAPPKTHVLAQGQILPQSGIIRLSAAPGDIVEKVNVQVGDDVPLDQELVVMRSAALREKQLLALEVQKKAATQEANQKISQASQQVRIAQAKLENVKAMESSLPRKHELLDIAKKQLEAAENVLVKLESISKNRLTKEFIGDLEIDRQRMAVRDAELKFRQQKETYDQAVDDVALAKKAAVIELEVAQELQQAAKSFSPEEVIDAQIATLEQEVAASKILSPTAGRILAVNAHRGEACIPQIPLLEMADLSSIVVEVEINDRDAAEVAPGQTATIFSRAFSKDITGKVLRVYPLIGKPQLKPLDPLARKDYRTKAAIIKLDNPTDAQQWLQLQVEVKIDTPNSGSNSSDDTL